MGWKPKLMRFLRWSLLLIVLFLGYLCAGFLSAREFAWWVVPALTLVTTTAVFVAKKVGPSPRASIVLAGMGITWVAFIALIGMETPDRYVSFATVGCLIGLAVGIFISTTKGPERSEVVRALRWALFMLVAGCASWLWDSAAKLLLLSPVSPDWLNWAVVALVLGVSEAIFISVAALVAPSHRAVVILLMAALGYTGGFWINEVFEDFPYSLLDVSGSSPRDAYLYLGILTWGIGVAAGGFAALRIPVHLDASWRIADATANQRRRYKGTAPYQDLDLDRKTFFGRGDESRSLLSLVLAERLVVLFAKSGMGKSSLINAGLAEPLRQRKYLPMVIRLNILSQELAQSVLDGVRQAARYARVDIVGGEGTSVWRFFKTAEFWSEHDDLLRPVLILDQFEEIFTLHNKEARKEFIGQLGELVRGRSGTPHSAEAPALMGQSLDDAAPDVKIVIALREDFLANLEELASEIPAILHNRFRLGPLSLEAARAATIEPARVANEAFQTATFTYQEAAVERMLAFLAKRRLDVEMTTSDEVEPVQLQIVCHYLEEVVRTRQAAEGNDIEIQVSESDLGGEEHMQEVLEGFYDRIIASVRPRRKSAAVQRLCETRLISRSGRRLTEDHEEIARRFKISEELLRHLVDARLLRAEARLGSTFYEVSHDRLVEAILQSRRKRLVKRRWVDAAAIVLGITVMGSYAYELFERKQLERDQLQLESMLFSPEPEKAIDAINGLVTRHRYRIHDVVQKMENRHLNPSVLMILDRELANLTDHKGAVNFVEFSVNGERLVSASDNGTARVWRADGSGTPVVLEGHAEPVVSAFFSPDGQRVVTASVDGTARVWRADGSGTPVVLKGHTEPVVSASFSPDGERVVTASHDSAVGLWYTDASGTPALLPGHKEPVRTVAFSPDGKLLASAGDDGKLILWSVEKTEPLETFSGHVGEINHVVFSPNGKTLASASEDGTVILWNREFDKTTEPHLKEVLEHIKKHYLSDLNPSPSSRDGIPTLLGSLISTLDTVAKFGDPKTSNQAMELRTRVINEYKIHLRTNLLLDSECMHPNTKARDSMEVTNQEYQCFYPGHSFSPNEAGMPVQVNWYEALAYIASQRPTLPKRARVDAMAIPKPKGAPENASSLNHSIGTWCVSMDIARDEKQFSARDEKQFSFLSASSSFRSTSPCLVKDRPALLKEKRKFLVPPDFVDSGEGQKNNTSWEGPPIR